MLTTRQTCHTSKVAIPNCFTDLALSFGCLGSREDDNKDEGQWPEAIVAVCRRWGRNRALYARWVRHGSLTAFHLDIRLKAAPAFRPFPDLVQNEGPVSVADLVVVMIIDHSRSPVGITTSPAGRTRTSVSPPSSPSARRGSQ